MFDCIGAVISLVNTLIEKSTNRRKLKVEIKESAKPCCIVYRDFCQPSKVPIPPLKSYTQLIQIRLINPSPKPVTVFDVEVRYSDSHLLIDYLTQEKIQTGCVEILAIDNLKIPPSSSIKVNEHSCIEIVLAINVSEGNTLEVSYKTDSMKRKKSYTKKVTVNQVPSIILNPSWESYHKDLEALLSYTGSTK